MTLDSLLEHMDEYLEKERYEELLDKFFYNELTEKRQEGINTPDSFTQNDLPNILKDGELFTENKQYLRSKANFMLFENGGELLVSVDSEGKLRGNATGTFSFPLEDESAKKAFALMLLYLQQCGVVKFPNEEFETQY